MNRSNRLRISGWVLSFLVVAFLIFGSAMGKFIEWEGKTEMFGHLGYSTDLMMKIGILEIVIAVLFLIPGMGFPAALLLTAYLGGATATHVRVGDPFFFPIIIGFVVWIALGMRRPEVFALLFDAKKSDAARKPATSDIKSLLRSSFNPSLMNRQRFNSRLPARIQSLTGFRGRHRLR